MLSVLLTAVPACNPSGADEGSKWRDAVHNQARSKKKDKKNLESPATSQDSLSSDADSVEIDTLAVDWSSPDSAWSAVIEEPSDSGRFVEDDFDAQVDESPDEDEDQVDGADAKDKSEDIGDAEDETDVDMEWEGEYGTEDPSDHVLTERMDRADVVRLLSPGPATAHDSILLLVERKMSIRPETPPEHIIVERWLSPVNFRGYKFNVRKLLVYGVDPKSDIQLYYYLEEYYFSIDRRVYELHETSAPRNFESVSDSTLTRYLISLVDSL